MNRRGSTQVERSRDVFAVGSIIIKSSHFHKQKSAEYTETGYTYADANEVEAIAIAKNVLKYIKVPDIYFNGEINGRQVSVQERLPGVALTVAWPYLSQSQKESFKQQAQAVLRQLQSTKPPIEASSAPTWCLIPAFSVVAISNP